jgi:hypothetical protein
VFRVYLLGGLLRGPMSFLINAFQGLVDILKFWGQGRQVAADIRGHFLAAVNAFVLFDVVGHFFRHRVVVAEKVAEYFFHGSRFKRHLRLWETVGAKFEIWVYCQKRFWERSIYHERQLSFIYWTAFRHWAVFSMKRIFFDETQGFEGKNGVGILVLYEFSGVYFFLCRGKIFRRRSLCPA